MSECATDSHCRSNGSSTSSTTSAQGTTTRSYDANIGFSAFEIDLFGRLRSLSHAAQQQYFASEAGVHTAPLTLVAEVAAAYLTPATDRNLLAISVRTPARGLKNAALNP